MISIKSDIIERKEESDQMLAMIEDVSSVGGGVVRSAILKSAYVVMLYNAIEATISLVLERIHEEISHVQYVDLIPELKSIWVEFFFFNHPQKTFQAHVDGAVKNNLTIPLLKEFSERVKLFSGNLDARKIDEILKKYGIGALSTPDRGQLLIIKTKRNKIAHGELSFKEGCRNMTKTELKRLQKATFSALDSIVNQVESYIASKKFRIL
ncbi:MAG: MAE_28990/MAE_18760 family HEPN-like nuclease [Janthinobacterium lividum]